MPSIYTYTRGLSLLSNTQYHRSTPLQYLAPLSSKHFKIATFARMISTKKLIQMAKKWQKMAARERKRISFGAVPRSNPSKKVAAIADKGHFVAYASDRKRYMVPLACLQRPIFQELLKMAEEEFGLNIDGAITFPCDSTIVDYIVSVVQKDIPTQMEFALIKSLRSSRCFSSSALPQSHCYQQMPLEGF